MFRSDTDIQKDVATELHWEPSLKDDDVAVGVRDGVATLAGFVNSYADKWTAERAASKVKGVKAIANNIEVKLPSSSTRPDPDIAHAAVSALKWNSAVPQDRVRVRVEKGWLTLEGDVDFYFQKEAAERSVRYLFGIKGLTNLITVRVRPMASDVKQKIKEALQRGAAFDAEHITIESEGNKVILKGTVRSYAEFRDAERAARNAPGVMEIENKLTVDPTVMATV
jgi:osmotically-inducible protein OsmY